MRDFGAARDLRVLDGLETYKYMRTDQIAELYFTTIQDKGQRIKKCNDKMRKLFLKGFVKRFRVGCEPYIYTVDNSSFSNKVIHYLTVVDVIIELQELKKNLPASSVLRWEAEEKIDDLICDLHLTYNNQFRHEEKDYFIEVELNSSGDVIQKINKYMRLFRSRRREGEKDDQLVVLCSKIHDVAKIKQARFDFPVKSMLIKDLGKKWTW